MEQRKRRKYYWRYRSAITGRCVSREYAERHPKTTVRERVSLGR
jgi:hypothetical protein